MSLYSLAQEVVALFGTVTAEALSLAHFIGGIMHSPNHCFAERESYIAYSKADNRSVRFFLLKYRNTFSYLAEEVAFL